MSESITPSLFDESLRNVSGIYLIQHIASKKVYVGSTNNLYLRRLGHFSTLRRKCHKNQYLQNAYNKYGRRAFRFVIVEECPLEILIEREQHWIEFYKATDKDRGYNIAPQAGGRAQSEETREKIRKAMTGRVRSEEHRRNLSKANKGQVPWSKGKHQSEHQKKCVSEALKGNKHFQGKKHSAETLQKIGDAQRRRYRERGFSSEAREKISRAQRAYWTPEQRAAHSERLRQYHADKKKAKLSDVEEGTICVA